MNYVGKSDRQRILVETKYDIVHVFFTYNAKDLICIMHLGTLYFIFHDWK